MLKAAKEEEEARTTMYTLVKVTVSTDQHDKLKNAVAHQKAASVKLILDHSAGGGEHVLLLTRGQIAKIERSRLIGKHKVTVHLSKRQVLANVQHQGGFLGLLAGLAAKALPAILGGLASGLVSGTVKHVAGARRRKKVTGGNGLYLRKSGHCVKVQPVKGNGLYLTPHRGGDFAAGVHGDGLYLKRGSTIQDGFGLIFGPNSPFKNIPILNLLL